jgi:hypothetical protein
MAQQYPQQPTVSLDQSLAAQSLTVPKFLVQYVAATQGRLPVVRDEISERNVQTHYQLRVGEKLITNSSRIEIRDEHGMILRLGSNSEVELIFDQNAKRYVLSWFGEVFKMRLTSGKSLQLNLCGKYRTSCWMCPMSTFAQNVDAVRDTFYALFDTVPIFEYDELGVEFPIIEVPEGHKVTLRHADSQPMRKRYASESVEPITSEEYEYITKHFLNPNRWRS